MKKNKILIIIVLITLTIIVLIIWLKSKNSDKSYLELTKDEGTYIEKQIVIEEQEDGLYTVYDEDGKIINSDVEKTMLKAYQDNPNYNPMF